MPSVPNAFDYVICGGGTVGCVLASRLSHAGHSVALIEAGPEDYSEVIMSPMAAPRLHETPYEYNFRTTKQPGLGNRAVPNYSGKLVSGSSGINYGLWTRGHSADYDAWAKYVGDERWSYKNMLPYLKKTETHHSPDGSKDAHGFSGPITTTAGARKYPLRQTIYEALTSSGLDYKPDGNDGYPFGVAQFTEAWKNAARQPAGKAYDLSKATVITDSPIAKVIFDGTKATGAATLDGHTYTAAKEVIVSCGALKTPQLLMLSGVGPAPELSAHGIHVLSDLPVGENLHDHISGTIFWKLREPEKGLALGSPAFNDPVFFTGNPMEWLATTSIPDSRLSNVISVDGLSPDDPLINQKRAHVEAMVSYAPIAGGGSDFKLPFDGTHISTPVVLLLPSSRGRVSLASTDPAADPLIDPCYLSTELDRESMRTGFRMALKAMETEAARSIVSGETPPPGAEPLTSDCADALIDERVKIVGSSFFQNAGTAAMGSVVDTCCRVKGVQGLRVCDASVLPLPIAGHYQAPMYAFAESMADVLLGQGKL